MLIFHSRRKKTSSGSFTIRVKNFSTFNQGYVKIGKAGVVRVRVHRPIDLDKTKNYCTISRNSIGEFYISVKQEIDIPDEPVAEPTSDNTIGCDFGVKDLAILDNGTKFPKFRIDRKVLKKRRRLNRSMSRKAVKNENGKIPYNLQSNHYKKIQRQIAKIDLTIARKRENYQYEVVKRIIGTDCDYIGIEDLNVKGMMSTGKSGKKKLTQEEYLNISPEERKEHDRKKPRQFNRALSDQALGELRLKLEWKAKKSGKTVVRIDRFYPSSQTCSVCGHINKGTKKLSVRKWTCPICGTEHDRDINAATNIRNRAVGTLGESRNADLPKCIGKVMSPETKLGEAKQDLDSIVELNHPAPIEGENNLHIMRNDIGTQLFANCMVSSP